MRALGLALKSNVCFGLSLLRGDLRLQRLILLLAPMRSLLFRHFDDSVSKARRNPVVMLQQRRRWDGTEKCVPGNRGGDRWREGGLCGRFVRIRVHEPDEKPWSNLRRLSASHCEGPRYRSVLRLGGAHHEGGAAGRAAPRRASNNVAAPPGANHEGGTPGRPVRRHCPLVETTPGPNQLHVADARSSVSLAIMSSTLPVLATVKRGFVPFQPSSSGKSALVCSSFTSSRSSRASMSLLRAAALVESATGAVTAGK